MSNSEHPHARALAEAIADAVGSAEASARHWYRLLVGADRPRPPLAPEEARLRSWLARVFPDDPARVEHEVRDMLADAADHEDAYCWGPDWRYLQEVLTARCGIRLSQIEEMTWTEIAGALEAAYRSGQRHAPAARLLIQDSRVLLDGRIVLLDMTEKMRGAALCLLTHLLAANGEWRSSTELNDMERNGPCKDHVEVRWDRVRRQLPACLQALIETCHRKGRRLSPDAWHS
jgi:hypothetical protein